MEKLTQTEIIFKVLEENADWTPSYKIIKINTRWGWLGTSADRFARWLAEDNIIEKKREGKYVYYRLPIDKQPSLSGIGFSPNFNADNKKLKMI